MPRTLPLITADDKTLRRVYLGYCAERGRNRAQMLCHFRKDGVVRYTVERVARNARFAPWIVVERGHVASTVIMPLVRNTQLYPTALRRTTI